MKIDRIQRLLRCRIFRDFSWPAGLKDFERFNLVFGWNGSGKTTLSTLFAGLEHGENRVGGECSLRVDGKALDCTVPTTKLPHLRVFNKDTVDRAVFEVPGTQLAPVYVLGEASVEKTKEVEQLKRDLVAQQAFVAAARKEIGNHQAALEAFCTNHAREIKNLLTTAGGGPYNNYDKSHFKEMATSLWRLKTAPERLSAETRRAYLAQKDSRPKDKLAPLPQDYPILPELTQAVDTALRKSVTSKVIQQLVDDTELSDWVRTGLLLHEHEATSCKFCGQALPAGLIQRLEAHFNDEFKAFERELDTLIGRIRALYDEIEALQPPTKGQVYDHLAEDYEKHRVSFMAKRDDVLTYLDKMEAAMETKRAKPFEVVQWNTVIAPHAAPDSEDGIMMALMKVLMIGAANWGVYAGTDALKRLSADIQRHNQHTDNFAGEIDKARKALERDEVIRVLPEYIELETRITMEQQTIDPRVIPRLETEIEFLQAQVRGQHSAAVALTADLASYLGRRELVFESRETGYTISREGSPAMHLSEGERTAIAFLYFLRTLSDSSFDRAKSVVVIDDPVSSLDANSIYSAFGYMKEHLKDVAQVFVLTHDFTFFKLVKEWFYYVGKRGRDDRYYMLQPIPIGELRAATIAELDPLLSEYQSEYHYLFKRVCQEAAAPQAQSLASCYQMPNIARRLLESFLAFRVPNTESLHNRMGSIQFSEAKRARILRFVDVHSHHERMPQAGHDPSILLETRAIMNELLEFMDAADKPHCDAMRVATA